LQEQLIDVGVDASELHGSSSHDGLNTVAGGSEHKAAAELKSDTSQHSRHRSNDSRGSGKLHTMLYAHERKTSGASVSPSPTATAASAAAAGAPASSIKADILPDPAATRFNIPTSALPPVARSISEPDFINMNGSRSGREHAVLLDIMRQKHVMQERTIKDLTERLDLLRAQLREAELRHLRELERLTAGNRAELARAAGGTFDDSDEFLPQRLVLKSHSGHLESPDNDLSIDLAGESAAAQGRSALVADGGMARESADQNHPLLNGSSPRPRMVNVKELSAAFGYTHPIFSEQLSAMVLARLDRVSQLCKKQWTLVQFCSFELALCVQALCYRLCTSK